MGFKNNKIKQKTGFTPLELNEGNIQALFNKCLATDTTKKYLQTKLETEAYRIFRGF